MLLKVYEAKYCILANLFECREMFSKVVVLHLNNQLFSNLLAFWDKCRLWLFVCLCEIYAQIINFLSFELSNNDYENQKYYSYIKHNQVLVIMEWQSRSRRKDRQSNRQIQYVQVSQLPYCCATGNDGELEVFTAALLTIVS